VFFALVDAVNQLLDGFGLVAGGAVRRTYLKRHKFLMCKFENSAMAPSVLRDYGLAK